MTKEEILKKCEFDSKWEFPHTDDIYLAMDEHAKQQSIDFARWIHKTYTPTMPNPDSWYKIGEIDKGRYTTEELYIKYLSWKELKKEI